MLQGSSSQTEGLKSQAGNLIWVLSPQNLVWTLAKIILFFTITGIASAYLKSANYPLPSSEWFADLFDLNNEFNLPAWYQAFALLFSAGLLAVIVHFKRQQRDHFLPRWRFLAGLFFFFFIDEVFSIHEILIIPAVREALNLPALFYHTWVIPGAILVGIFCIKYLKFFQHLPFKFKRLFLLAGSIYVGGALITEMVNGVFGEIYGYTSLLNSLLTVVEEVLEKIGILVWIYALLKYIQGLTRTISIEVQIKGK